MKQIIGDTAQQGSQEWLDARKNFRNASETADVMGCGFNSPNKLKRIKAGLEAVFVNNAMKRGNDLEDMVRTLAEDNFGEMFSPQVWENGKYRASLDGISFDQKTLIEIKVSDFTYGKVTDGEIPENYMHQIQHQLYCCPAEVAYLVAFSPAEDAFVVSDKIEFEPSLWDEVDAAWIKFEDMDIPPEEYVEIDSARYTELDVEYVDIKLQIDELSSQLKEVKAEMEIIANGRNIKAEFTKLNYATKKGAVDYKKVLKDLDLKVNEDSYRKPSTTYATIRVNKDGNK